MATELDPHDPPRSDRIHPGVYKVAIALAVWLVL